MVKGGRSGDEASVRRLTPQDLAWLVCPVCRAALDLWLEVAAPDGLAAEAVRCGGCGRRYPLVEGIPILLADRATRHI